jgi:hypothetical protein
MRSIVRRREHTRLGNARARAKDTAEKERGTDEELERVKKEGVLLEM